MASVKIQLYKHKKLEDGSHPIIMQIIKDRKKKTIWLGYYAKPEQWNYEANVPNSKHPNSVRLANKIREKLTEVTDAILDLERNKKPFTVSDIVNNISEDKRSNSILPFTDKTIKKMESLGQIGNSRVYRNTYNVFKEFRKGQDIEFRFIDYKLLNEFQDYLIMKGNKTNTNSIHFRTLRAIYYRAIKEGEVNEEFNPFKKFKIKSEPTQKRAIKKDDIDKIRNLKIKAKPELIKARDLFLFSFYNRGMSFVDIAYLKAGDIKKDRIYYTRRKTGQKFSIKLVDKSMEIIEKYSDLKNPEDYIFPILLRKGQEYLDYRNAMRLMNKKLKILSKLADIEEPITTYTARHSWATIAKRAGIPTAVISEGLGHETEETTQIYLDSFENDVLDDANELIIK